MQIRLFRFTKRSNSTARPSTDGWPVDVLLKDETSILRPSFLLKHDPTEPAEVYDYNYVFCQEFERYYHITNIEAVRNDLWRIDCDVDVLASWKTQIQAASAFVAYDATLPNTQIVDSRLSVQTDNVLQIRTGTFQTLGLLDLQGYQAIVITVIGKTNIARYLIQPIQAAAIMQQIDNWMDGADILPIPAWSGSWTDSLRHVAEVLEVMTHNLTTGFRQLVSSGKASDNIMSAITLPTSYPALVSRGTSTPLLLGSYDTGLPAVKLNDTVNDRYLIDSADVAIPWVTADWRRQSPYTMISLYIPYLGYINISPASVMNDVTIRVTATVDIFSGDCLYTVYGVNSNAGLHPIGRYSTNIAAPYSIGRSNQTPLNTVTNLITAAGGAAAMLGGNPAGASGVIGGVIGSIEPQPTAISSAGGGTAIAEVSSVTLTLNYHDTNVAPSSVNAVIGTPTMETAAMSIFSGYVETRHFSVSGAMTERERTEINNLMDGGVYIE